MSYLYRWSELLAITGKLAASSSQVVPDQAVAQAVADIEVPGSRLSRKSRQKISLVHAMPLASKPTAW